MTTARQIRALTRPLIERHPDLTLVKHMLWLTPATHVLRQIWIHRYSDPNTFRLNWTIAPTFLPTDDMTETGGRCGPLQILRHSLADGEVHLWQWDDPTMAGDFVHEVECRLLPLLRPLETLEVCYPFVEAQSGGPWGRWSAERLAFHAAFGDLAAARAAWEMADAACRAADQRARAAPKKAKWGDFHMSLVEGSDPRLPERIREIGPPLMDDDRAAVAAVLHRWERENVAGTAVEPFWTPTPFPLESMA